MLSDYFVSIFWLILNSILCFVIYEAVIKNWNYFSKQNVKFIRGLPIIGAHFRALFGLIPVSQDFNDCYKKFPNERIIGLYEMGGRPFYMIRDPELVKQVSIKDFDHFVNHATLVHESSDPLLGRALFNMKDQRWRNMRATLSPAFTGSKMRLMFMLINNVGDKLCDHVNNNIKAGNKDLELLNLFTGVSSDIIATCAFGIEMNSTQDKNNEFYKCGKRISAIGLKFLAYGSMPKLMNFLKVRVFNDKDTALFRRLVKENIEYRMKNNVTRNDMIDLLIEAKKGTLKYTNDEKDDDFGFATVAESDIGKMSNEQIQDWSDDDFAAQCIVFFLAGFLGITQLMCFAGHELAVNPDIQEKLYREVKKTQEELNGKPPTYPVIQKMKYLDMFISETLRRWPLAANGERITTKPYVIDNQDGTKVQLNVGDGLWLPTIGIHMDPQYFPNPEQFDPERFNDENRSNNLSTIYTPFGTGPRNCIANRFALMSGKAIVYHLVSQFHLEKCDKTQLPLQLKRLTVNVEAKNGFWVKFNSRKK